MEVLISNDDGVQAPGIKELEMAIRAVKGVNVTVVAPDRNKSGASHSLSVTLPLRINEIEKDKFSVTGTPTDCVHLALTGCFENKKRFDLVVSGINNDANLGDDIVYSGTFAAAREGRLLGVPAIAISLAGIIDQNPKHFDTAAHFTAELVKKIKNKSIIVTTLFNINVPDLSLDLIRGVEITRLGKRSIAKPAIKLMDPRNTPIYWIGLSNDETIDAGPGTDFYAIKNRKISITPIQLDSTDYKSFDYVSNFIHGGGHEGKHHDEKN